MKGIRALCLWLLLLPVGGTSAQLVEKVRDILGEDSSAVTTTYIERYTAPKCHAIQRT